MVTGNEREKRAYSGEFKGKMNVNVISCISVRCIHIPPMHDWFQNGDMDFLSRKEGFKKELHPRMEERESSPVWSGRSVMLAKQTTQLH